MQRSGGRWKHVFTLKELGKPCKCILGKNFGATDTAFLPFPPSLPWRSCSLLCTLRKCNASSFRSFPVSQEMMLMVPVSSPTDERDLVEKKRLPKQLPHTHKRKPAIEEQEPNPDSEVRWTDPLLLAALIAVLNKALGNSYRKSFLHPSHLAIIKTAACPHWHCHNSRSHLHH